MMTERNQTRDQSPVNGPISTRDLPAAAIGGALATSVSMAAGSTMGAAAGGVTGWGIGMTGGYLLGLVTGMLTAISLTSDRL